MNGFANGIMSMLLGWLRVVISNLWQLMVSPDGSLFFQFMSEHWKGILAALLLGGLVVDRLVYFLRWRPDYIWASRRGRKARRRRAEDEPQEDNGLDDEGERDEENAHESLYAANGTEAAANAAVSGSTRAYAPAAAGNAFAAAGYAPAQSSYAPVQPGFAPSATNVYKSVQPGFAPSAANVYKPASASFAPSDTSVYKPANASFAPSATALYAPMHSPTRKAHVQAAKQTVGAAFDTAHGTFAPPAKSTVDGEAAQSRISIQKQSVKPLYSARGAATKPEGFAESTKMFAPMARVASGQPTRIRAIGPLAEMSEPIFDDDPPALAYSPKQGEGRMSANPAKGMVNSFGNAMPEPAAYLRDMSAGFAPQLPPERMYPPNEEPPPEDAAKQQIHPGLGSDAFRQSFGLDRDVGGGDGSIGTAAPLKPAPALPDAPPAFTPYAEAFDNVKQPSGRRANPFAVIAKKARDLVGVEDDAHKLTIRDLQSTVDMRTAFREPVYPRAKPDDDSEG